MAQLYLFKSLTYSEKNFKHKKRKEFIEKAFKLDDRNPLILRFYGKYLSYNNKHEKAINILDKAIKLIDDGAEIDPYNLVRLYTTMAWSLTSLEFRKIKKDRDYTNARNYLGMALLENEKLIDEESQLDYIQTKLARIETESGNFGDAIHLLNESLKNEKKKIGNGFSINSAFNYANLGMCHAMILKRNNNPESYKNGVAAFSMAEEIFKNLNGEKHSSVGFVYLNWASLEAVNNNIDLAISYSLKSNEIYNSYEIPHTQNIAANHANLARYYYKKEMYKESRTQAKTALSIFREKLPENHREIVVIKELIAMLESK